MNKILFQEWLKKFKKEQKNNIEKIISDCDDIEKNYGNLDDQYGKDQLNSIFRQISEDSSESLKFYLEFKKNKIIEELKRADDIEPDSHDGSYELIRETVNSLSKVDINELDYKDLDLLYLMAVGTWKNGIEPKKNNIQKSHLSDIEKERLLSILEKVILKAKNHEYENYETKNSDSSIGMFGTGFNSFYNKTEKKSVEKFISLCVDLNDMTDDEEMFERTSQTIKNGMKGMQSAAVSVVLHCLKPKTFPVINNAVNDTEILFKIEGVQLTKLNILEYYIQNAKEIKKFRDEKCKFKNYRVMDLILSKFNREKNETDNSDEIRYWWVNSKPSVFSFSNIAVGETDFYTMHNKDGHKRRIYKNFKDAKIGDMVIAYESSPVHKITTILKVTSKIDDDRIYFEKVEGLVNPLDSSVFKDFPELENMEYNKNQQGSFFKLSKSEYDFIIKLIRERNPVFDIEIIEPYTKSDFLNEVFITEVKYDRIVSVLKNKLNIILQGAPGVGKTFAAKRLAYSIMKEKDESRIEFIQFHQNYSYENFIMGYKPVENGFMLKEGIFYRFCKKAAENPDKEFFFIIDEINRGNMSKIFGELLMLIEKDYRGTKTTLAYNGVSFSVPGNLYIIGMMNTADRSLAMIDYALRRRFSFIDMESGFDSQGFIQYQQSLNNKTFDDFVDKIKELNKEIENDKSLGKGFCIGHSYLYGNELDCSENRMREIVEFDILPMISEYWFDDADKLKRWEISLQGVFK